MSYLLEALVKAEQRSLGDAVPRIDTHHDYRVAKAKRFDIKAISMILPVVVLSAGGALYFLAGTHDAVDRRSEQSAVESVAKGGKENSAVAIVAHATPASPSARLPATVGDPTDAPGASRGESMEVSPPSVAVASTVAPAIPGAADQTESGDQSVQERRAAILAEMKTKIERQISVSHQIRSETSDAANANEMKVQSRENVMEAAVQTERTSPRGTPDQAVQAEHRRIARHEPVSERIPFVFELPDEFVRRLPEMTVSVHLYSESPKERMLMANNKVLHEGDQIAPGLTIDRITENGMILNYENRQFQLDAYGTLGGIE